MKPHEIKGSEDFLKLNKITLAALAAGTGRVTQPPRWSQGADRGMVETESRLGYCITIIQFRHRLLDEHDNLRASIKPLVDQITRFLRFQSDDDKRLHWEYGQMIAGTEGVLVKIQPL